MFVTSSNIPVVAAYTVKYTAHSFFVDLFFSFDTAGVVYEVESDCS